MTNFKAGWHYFWHVFTRPRMFVLGFILGVVILSTIGQLTRKLAEWVFPWLRIG